MPSILRGSPGGSLGFGFLLFAVLVVGFVVPLTGAGSPRHTIPQRPPPSDKDALTPAERKLDSQILYEIRRREHSPAAPAAPPLTTIVKIDRKGRALVDVRARITPELEKTIRSFRGAIVSTSAEYHSIVAWVPLSALRQLAADPAVVAIVPAAEAIVGSRSTTKRNGII